ELDELRVLALDDLLDGEFRVQVARVDVVQCLLLREPLLLLAVAEVGARELHQVFGVALVHDREVAGQARLGAELPEQPMAGGVEGPALHPARRRADEALGAGEHLVRGAAGEGEEENALGRDAATYKVGDTIDEGARLPRAGAGDDEEGPVAMDGGGGLFG